MKAETDALFSLRHFCKFNPMHLGTCPSLGVHPAELHCYTSLRVLAKKRWVACAKLGRKNGRPSWAMFNTVCRMVSVWRVFNNTRCRGAIYWISFKMTGFDYLCKNAGLRDVAAAPSNGTKMRAQAKSPLTLGHCGEPEPAQRPTVTAHTCFHAATPRGGRRQFGLFVHSVLNLSVETDNGGDH